MGYTLSLVLLAAAISLDSFSTGLAYGLRKIWIPFKSIVIISMMTAASLAFAMLAGKGLVGLMSPEAANRIGGIILICIGTWVVIQFFKTDQNPADHGEKHVLKWEIKSLGIVIHILRKPTRADFDRSGTINGLEALFLGAALSLDAFGAGIGAAMIGYSPALLAGCAAIMSGMFLAAGLRMGRLFSKAHWLQKFAFMPGVLLICIGLIKM